jgi:hypothetical protein
MVLEILKKGCYPGRKFLLMLPNKDFKQLFLFQHNLKRCKNLINTPLLIIIEPGFLEHCRFRGPDKMVSGSGALN